MHEEEDDVFDSILLLFTYRGQKVQMLGRPGRVAQKGIERFLLYILKNKGGG